MTEVRLEDAVKSVEKIRDHTRTSGKQKTAGLGKEETLDQAQKVLYEEYLSVLNLSNPDEILEHAIDEGHELLLLLVTQKVDLIQALVGTRVEGIMVGYELRRLQEEAKGA